MYDRSGVKRRPEFLRSGKPRPAASPAPIDEAGASQLSTTKSRIAKLDPDGAALRIAFLTDTHRCGEGIEYAAEGIVDDSYTMHLLSRLCDEVAIDAVFIGGDTANARSENIANHVQNMEDVAGDLDTLLPFTNVFFTIGNHDKRYAQTNPITANKWFYDLYSPIQMAGRNATLAYIDETNFYVDFYDQKIRVISVNQYDAVSGSQTASSTHCTGSWEAALDIEDKQDWHVLVIYHGNDDNFPALKAKLAAYVTGGGKGSFGTISGHWHSNTTSCADGFNNVHTHRAYAKTDELGTADAYRFDVFLLFPTGEMHQIRVGRDSNIVPFTALMEGQNGGLLDNGTAVVSSSYDRFYCISGGNHVRFDRRWNATINGMNFTNLSKEWGYYSNDFVTGDTDNVLFSASAGDVIKTEIIFSEFSGTTNRNFKVFSPQIADMVTGTVVSGKTYSKEITLSADTDVTAIGMYYKGQSSDGAGYMDFDLNVYKNGVKLVREESEA